MVKKNGTAFIIICYMKDADKRIASEIFYSALKAVAPYSSVKLYADRILSVYHSNNFKRVFVIGFGKAACPMAKAMEDNLMDIIDTGVVITKYGHATLYDSNPPIPLLPRPCFAKRGRLKGGGGIIKNI